MDELVERLYCYHKPPAQSHDGIDSCGMLLPERAKRVKELHLSDGG